MTKPQNNIERYLRKTVDPHPILGTHLDRASIVLRGAPQIQHQFQDRWSDWDIECFLPKDAFTVFAEQHGSQYAIADDAHHPPVFLTIRSYEWLQERFNRECAIATWKYRAATILRDPQGSVDQMIRDGCAAFAEQRRRYALEKYVRFRSQRHDLKSCLGRRLPITATLVQHAMVKNVLEFALLAHGEPYPYRKWLPTAVEMTVPEGTTLTALCREFLDACSTETITTLGDRLLAAAIALGKHSGIPETTLHSWWLHLD